MNNIRLGYACINTSLKDKKICVNKTCRLKTAIDKGDSQSIFDFLSDLAITNLTNMFKILSWNRKNNIYFYRMSSDMFPHVNNHRIQKHMSIEHWHNYSNLIFAKSLIHKIGQYAQKYQIRLTMHPDHFNQLGAKKEEVLVNTITDLAWHARLLDLLEEGADLYNLYLKYHNRNLEVKENIIYHSILCIHGGGKYDSKEKTLQRWKDNFRNLPKYIQKRICLENDERCYNVKDLLPVCQELNIPLIFDFHHYDCWAHYHQDNPNQLHISDFLPDILKTWEKRNITPKFHLSDQADGKRVGAHHDYVGCIPDELLDLIKQKYKFDIMIEAKQKDLAVLKLQEKYSL